MRQLAIIAVLALGIAACGGKSDQPTNAVVNEPDAPPAYNVDECPRADGSPCA